MKKTMIRAIYCALAVCSVSIIPTGTDALAASNGPHEYPNRPIHFVLPFPPGGATDALARIIAPKLSQSMGQQWVVDNRGGAGGNIATEVVAKAAPDGYTVLMGFATSLTVNPALYKNLPFNVLRDFQPVAQIGAAQFMMVTHPSVPATSIKEFVTLAKAKPGVLNYSSGGIGTPLHLAAELFKYKAGVKMVHIPYKGGSAAVVAVLNGEAQVLFGSLPAAMPHVKAGKLRALAVTGLKRADVAPNVPTLGESGFPGFDVRTWYGFLVPAKTPEAVVNRLYKEALAVMKFPEVKDAMAQQGLEVSTSSPEEFAAVIKSETATWAELIKAADIRAE